MKHLPGEIIAYRGRPVDDGVFEVHALVVRLVRCNHLLAPALIDLNTQQAIGILYCR
jgi:hypothetical protein